MTEANFERLAEVLKALGNPNRLELLHALRAPRAVSDIALRPEPSRSAMGGPDRAISHQAVRDHLAKLRELGVVAVQRAERDGGIVDEFVLNHQQLFAIVEELRGLGELRAEREVPLPTMAAGREAASARDQGTRFVLVRGQGEGRVFPLRKDTLSADRGWIVGRKHGIAVNLDYDPFVSAENAEVLLTGEGFQLLDIRSSRNGTFLNFRPLPRGGSAALRDGDVVSVGRTNLVFRDG